MSSVVDEHTVPPGPPPLLDADQIKTLCIQGWIPYNLPPQLHASVEQLTNSAGHFFTQSTEEKSKAFTSGRETEEGYYEVPDEKEYITFRRASAHTSNLETEASQVWKNIAQLLHRVLCDLSRAGGLDLHAWDGIVQDTLSFPASSADLRDTTSLMRLFRYEAATGIAEQHTDLGLLTLCVGTGRGLEVMDWSGDAPRWTDATSCAILVGETLRALAQGNMRAGMHRVVGNPAGRQSLVFAMRPNLGASVDTALFGGEGVVSLRQVFTDIKGSKYNVNAKKEVRERQQAARREGQTKVDAQLPL